MVFAAIMPSIQYQLGRNWELHQFFDIISVLDAARIMTIGMNSIIGEH
jgi:hypothetical protein